MNRAGSWCREGVRGVPEKSPADKRLELRNKVVKLLAEEGCTVRDANYILTQASRAINATAPVQPVQGADYEF